MKKRIFAWALSAALMLGLVGCGDKKPGLEEVEAAIAAGDVTMEDALEKGWITQEWIDKYTAQNSIEAGNKFEAGAIADFTTTTLSGEEFTQSQMGEVTLFAFLDPDSPEAATFYQSLVTAYDGVVENGAEIVVCTKNEKNNAMFENAPFPVILYNDSLRSATESHKEMIEGMENTASWCVNGSFFSAWYFTVKADNLTDSSKSYVQMLQEMAAGDSVENGGMAAIG